MLIFEMTLSQKKKNQFHWGKRLIRPVASNSPLMELSHFLSVSLSPSRDGTSTDFQTSFYTLIKKNISLYQGNRIDEYRLLMF